MEGGKPTVTANAEGERTTPSIVVAGGGGCLIRNFGTYDKSRVTIIDDICATAKGYESLAYMSLKRRG